MMSNRPSWDEWMTKTCNARSCRTCRIWGAVWLKWRWLLFAFGYLQDSCPPRHVGVMLDRALFTVRKFTVSRSTDMTCRCGVCRFALTKLDILDDQPVIKIGVAYLVNGQKIDYYPRMCCSRVLFHVFTLVVLTEGLIRCWLKGHS